MLGFVLAAVSPAVIIPCLMSLSGRGYGVAKGIPTLVIAACSADDVVAISGFGIFLGLTFIKGKPLWGLILRGPIEVIIGVSFGVFWGILAQWIPNKDHHHVAFFRWLILLGGGLIALFGAHLIHYDGAGKVVEGVAMEMPSKDPDPDKKKKPAGPVKKAYKRTKSRLQENRLTQKCFPPQGEVATTMTLILTIIAIFFAARTVLGPIADVGGTIFALLMLILIALIGGKLIMLFSWLLLRYCKVDIRLPPLLGMLVVGILLKNMPYNFGQFGRAECTADHKNATFVDSLTEFDPHE